MCPWHKYSHFIQYKDTWPQQLKDRDTCTKTINLVKLQGTGSPFIHRTLPETFVPFLTALCLCSLMSILSVNQPSTICTRKFLSSKTTEILVHASVSSKIDYCNSLSYNVPKYVFKKLQSVQNAAAHLITCSRKYDHIAPLCDLHWLPVNEHIKFKILLLTFKALHQLAFTYIQNLVTRY